MLYNPWRAFIQLLGSMFILAWVDWRLLLGALVLVPAVYFTHRTWIGRIRPQHRDMRIQRKAVDAHATEAFSGVRVVRKHVQWYLEKLAELGDAGWRRERARGFNQLGSAGEQVDYLHRLIEPDCAGTQRYCVAC